MDKIHISPHGGGHPRKQIARDVKMQIGTPPNQGRWIGMVPGFFISMIASIRCCTFLLRDMMPVVRR